jgi:predicted  nucleic acid-binding Zn-ribbon protein
MKRFSFNTFLEADGNRAALRICKRIAELAPVSPMPVLLLGEEGCGKTHLLYSIWKRVKATSPRTSLAVVTAREFRQEVLDLIEDPSPVEKAESAILLIDQLELFDVLLDELEAVVRIFINNNRYVLLASNVHPRRLNILPQGLRNIIAAGQIVDIRLREGETQLEVLRRQLRRESEAVVEKQQVEIDRLRGLLERVGASAGGAEASAAVREALEQARARNAELTRQLDTATRLGLGLQEELESVKSRLDTAERGETSVKEADSDDSASSRAALDEAHSELEALRRELARRGDTEEEVEHLRAALAAIQAEKSRSLAETAAEQETERQRLEEQVAALAQELETARSDSAQARHEANMLVERAERLVSQIEGNQLRFRETEQKQRRQIEELETLLAMQGPAEMQDERLVTLQEQVEESEERVRILQEEFEQERRELIERLEQDEQRIQDELSRAQEAAHAALEAHETLTGEYNQLRDALKNAEDERESLRAQLGTFEQERESFRSQLDDLEQERESLRAQLDPLEQERDSFRNQLNDLEQERESLRAQLEALEQERESLKYDLDASRSEHATAESALEELRQARENLESELNEGHAERDRLREELEQAHRENQRLQSTFDESREHLDTVQSQAQLLEARLAEQAADMDALRHDAAAQVARANAQAGELEGQIALLRSQLAQADESRREAARRIEEMRANLAASANVLGEWSLQLAAHEAPPEASGEELDDVSWAAQQTSPQASPADAADSARDDRLPSEIDGEDHFDAHPMVLPPAPDEEDIEPDAGHRSDSAADDPARIHSDAPADFDVSSPPLEPLKDLSPLDDEQD